jgi:hypothetical protein
MLRWSIEVLEDGKQAELLDMPGTIDKSAIIELIRLLAAKALTFKEMAGCIWSEHYDQLGLLDIKHHDEGRTLACGDGLVAVYARLMWRTPKG